MAHDVFISYASKDKPTADAVCHALEQNEVRCWIAPRDETAGIDYAVQITKAIEGSALLVLLFSASSNASRDVFREVGIALDNSKTVIPFRIDNAPMSQELGYLLRGIHWLDAYPDRRVFDNLVEHVRRNLGLPSVSTKESPSDSPASLATNVPSSSPDVAKPTSNVDVSSSDKLQGPGLPLAELKPRMRLRGLTLTGANFSGANLKESIFAKTSLIGANFSAACLTKTDFSNANLEDADLTGADIRDSRLPWVNLQRANLTEADLTWARLTRADLTEATLDRANLTMVDARDANFAGASAQGAIFVSALLNDADCQDADFSGADFQDAVLDGALLQGANLTGAKNLTPSQLQNAEIDATTKLDF